MSSLMFVVPVYKRLELARVCLRQLARTCESLREDNIHASAVVVIAKDEFGRLRSTINQAGFGFVQRDNTYLGRKFNDGIQLACDPRHNKEPADYVVPFGSDDWADHRLFLSLPDQRTVVGFQRMSFVNETAAEIKTTYLRYKGGSGIRIIPRELVAALQYRPADEDRRRGCDTSILSNIHVHWGDKMRVEHRHLHDAQLVDWKTPGIQLNGYLEVTRIHQTGAPADPFEVLAETYPEAALEEMRSLYQLRGVAA